MIDHKYPFVCGAIVSGTGWFRLFGYGFSWKDVSIHGLMFSERNGHRPGHRIGKIIFHALRP